MPVDGSDAGTAAFYDDLADAYHLIYADWAGTVEHHGAVLAGLLSEAGVEPPAAVLDCACGIGTQALGLAARGYAVAASDLSPASVARAAREAAARGLALGFRVADMRELQTAVPGRYAAVLAADNALPHLQSTDDLARALAAIAAELQPDGVFLASLRDYDRALAAPPQVEGPRFLRGPDGRRRFVHQVWDWLDSRRYRVHLYITEETATGWRCRHHAGLYRALLRGELEAALDAAGLADVAWHAAADTGFHQPIVTARRP